MEDSYLNQLIQLYNTLEEIKRLKIANKDYDIQREQLNLQLLSFEITRRKRNKAAVDLYLLYLIKDYIDNG